MADAKSSAWAVTVAQTISAVAVQPEYPSSAAGFAKGVCDTIISTAGTQEKR